MNSIICIDWLQVSGRMRYKNVVDEKKVYQLHDGFGIFVFQKRDYPAADFRSVYNIMYADADTGELVDFACVCADWNFREKIGKDLQVLKVYNSALYRFQLDKIESMIDVIFKYDRIMRVDICCDIQKFSNIKCEDFIRNVAAMHTLPSNTNKKVQIVSQCKHYESLTVGTRDSICRAYLYNKTKELKISEKAYIKNLHELVFNTSGDVWRLELSILKTSQIQMNDKYICDFKITELSDNLQLVFNALYDEFWQFKTNASRRKTQDATPQLDLGNSTFVCRKRKYQDKRTKKIEKIVVRALLHLNECCHNLRIQELPKAAINYYIDSNNLGQWAADNLRYDSNGEWFT